MIKKFLFVFLISILFNFQNIFAKVENNIVLKVENEIITNFEIKNKIIATLILANQEINQSNINKLKKQALDFLIKQKLKKIELSKYNLKVDQQKITSYLNSISSNNINGLKEKFSISGIDFQLFYEELEIDFLWQKYIYQVYSNKIEIDEKNINQELENLLRNQTDVEQLRISEIEIYLNNDLTDQKKIMNIKEQINKHGFEATAVKYSISSTASNKGELGWLNAKSLNKKIFNVVSKIKVGEVTEPIITSNSALFLKLNEKKISKVDNLNIDELKVNLINRKKNEIFNLYSRSLLSKLKNNSLIEYN